MPSAGVPAPATFAQISLSPRESVRECQLHHSTTARSSRERKTVRAPTKCPTKKNMRTISREPAQILATNSRPLSTRRRASTPPAGDFPGATQQQNMRDMFTSSVENTESIERRNFEPARQQPPFELKYTTTPETFVRQKPWWLDLVVKQSRRRRRTLPEGLGCQDVLTAFGDGSVDTYIHGRGHEVLGGCCHRCRCSRGSRLEPDLLSTAHG